MCTEGILEAATENWGLPKLVASHMAASDKDEVKLQSALNPLHRWMATGAVRV